MTHMRPGGLYSSYDWETDSIDERTEIIFCVGVALGVVHVMRVSLSDSRLFTRAMALLSQTVR